ncbi:hypothetical protein [Reyranella soli]|uniref:Uncharacterized protein n=1 Tax=Reyranella soli TaxID=1230389 RepID=A0A512NQH6_9HYPH|nr:hypothetical protein [Reyranella soli]GEP61205.1 hypothetical protein RSO01_83710 [Reyranella soli]
MVISDKAVLAFGILSVIGVFAYNHHRAYAGDLPVVAVEMAAAVRENPAPELPRGYLTNPDTSPLAGVMIVGLVPASPIRR